MESEPAELWSDVERVSDDGMAPRVKGGCWVRLDRRPLAVRLYPSGQLLAARIDGVVVIRELVAEDGALWLTALSDAPPVRVGPGVEIVGVVRSVLLRP